jgi:hypothetical protein
MQDELRSPEHEEQVAAMVRVLVDCVERKLDPREVFSEAMDAVIRANDY